MTMINPTTGWFEIVEVPKYDLDEVKKGNDEYIDKSYASISQLFKNKWLRRYPRPQKIMFDNGSSLLC